MEMNLESNPFEDESHLEREQDEDDSFDSTDVIWATLDKHCVVWTLTFDDMNESRYIAAENCIREYLQNISGVEQSAITLTYNHDSTVEAEILVASESAESSLVDTLNALLLSTVKNLLIELLTHYGIINAPTLKECGTAVAKSETAEARITDQKMAGVCVRHAIASAIEDQVNWKTEGNVDLDPESIITALMNLHDHAKGISPMAFNNKTFMACTADNNRWWYRVDIQIHRTTKMHRESAHKSKEIPGQKTYRTPLCRSTCVISHPMNGVYPGSHDPKNYHCIYLLRFDSDANAWIGQNSWGALTVHVNPKIPFVLKNVNIYDVVVTKLIKVPQGAKEKYTVVGTWKKPKHLEDFLAKHTNFWNRWGLAGGVSGKSKKRCFEEALKINPESSESWSNLGDAGGGFRKSEKECYEEALKLDSENLMAWNGLGRVGGGLGKSEGQCYEEAKRLEQEFIMASERNPSAYDDACMIGMSEIANTANEVYMIGWSGIANTASDHENMVNLMSEGAEAAITDPDVLGKLLTDACKNFDIQCVKRLLSNNADPSWRDEEGRTPAWFCCDSSFKEAHEFLPILHGSGADLDIPDKEGRTPVHTAAARGKIECLKYLAEKGVNLNRKDKNGRTPLHIATASGEVESLVCLAESGVDINATDNSGRTSVYIAASAGYTNCLQALGDTNADLNLRTKHGETAVHAAVSNRNLDCLKYLASKKANLIKSARNGWTPVHQAAVACDNAEFLEFFAINEGINLLYGFRPKIKAVATGDCLDFLNEYIGSFKIDEPIRYKRYAKDEFKSGYIGELNALGIYEKGWYRTYYRQWVKKKKSWRRPTKRESAI